MSSEPSKAAVAFAAIVGVRSAVQALGALLELEPDVCFEGHGRADVAAVLTELQARVKRPNGVPGARKPAG